MKTIGIAIDPWKLKIFSRRLKAAGYVWTEHEISKDLMLLKIITDSIEALQRVVEAAQIECASN